ncbi:MAG: hypothetical protein ABI972_22140 [Acidobacteriota bacterium]
MSRPSPASFDALKGSGSVRVPGVIARDSPYGSGQVCQDDAAAGGEYKEASLGQLRRDASTYTSRGARDQCCWQLATTGE